MILTMIKKKNFKKNTSEYQTPEYFRNLEHINEIKANLKSKKPSDTSSISSLQQDLQDMYDMNELVDIKQKLRFALRLDRIKNNFIEFYNFAKKNLFTVNSLTPIRVRAGTETSHPVDNQQ